MRVPPLAFALLVAGCGTGLPATDDLLGGDDSGAPDMTSGPARCFDGTKNFDETDIDCGGACGPCAVGKGCMRGSDCRSGVCSNNVCSAPSCSDGVENGDETDLDCGGSCPGCGLGKSCKMESDCSSKNCTNQVCVGSLCADGKKDGNETDVDCGGGACPTCPDGKACQMGADCMSGLCTNNICKTVSIDLGIPVDMSISVDMAIPPDLAVPDMAVADLALPDMALAPADMAVADMAMPDMTMAPADMAVADTALAGDLATCMNVPPGPTAAKLSDPAPTQMAIPNGIAIRKDLNAFPAYGVSDAACDVLYTGEVGAWKFAVPMVNIKSATVVLSAVADDHGAVSINLYSTKLWSGNCVFDNPAALPHGTPFNTTPFNDWVQVSEPAALVPGGNFTVTLQNTSKTGNGDWIAVDWIELRIITQ